MNLFELHIAPMYCYVQERKDKKKLWKFVVADFPLTIHVKIGKLVIVCILASDISNEPTKESTRASLTPLMLSSSRIQTQFICIRY